MRIRDPGWKKLGSRILDGKSHIRDKHPGSATLESILTIFWVKINADPGGSGPTTLPKLLDIAFSYFFLGS
jgi:hypothetical protein